MAAGRTPLLMAPTEPGPMLRGSDSMLKCRNFCLSLEEGFGLAILGFRFCVQIVLVNTTSQSVAAQRLPSRIMSSVLQGETQSFPCRCTAGGLNLSMLWAISQSIRLLLHQGWRINLKLSFDRYHSLHSLNCLSSLTKYKWHLSPSLLSPLKVSTLT